MAITSSPGDGVRITTASKNGTLGSQVGAASDEIIFDTNISTNNGNLTPTPTFVGRLVIVRQGTGTEETKYITAIAGDGVTATVHEPWSLPPASADTYHISYIIEDTAEAAGFALLNKRTNDYEVTRKFTVGNSPASGFAYYALLDGASIETGGLGATTTEQGEITVTGDGRFDVGYLSSGSPVSGGALFHPNGTTGNWGLEVLLGGEANFYDLYVKGVVNYVWQLIGDCRLNRVKVYSSLYSMDLTGVVSLVDCSFEGLGSTNDTLDVDPSTVTTDLALISSNGFLHSSTATEIIELRNVNFVGNLRLLLVNSNETWNIVNPSWVVDTASQNDIDFVTASSDNLVKELFSFDSVVTNPNGSAISAARVKISEHLLNDDIPHFGSTDPNGLYSVDILKRVFTDNADTSLTVNTRGNFALKVYSYGEAPFVGSLTVEAPIEESITLTGDQYIVNGSAAAALTAGSGIAISRHAPGETDIRPMKVLHYDAGSGTIPSPGSVVSGGTSGGSGTVVESIGDAVFGYLVLELWNGTEFLNDEPLSVAASWSASANLSGDSFSYYEEYTWEVDCNSLTPQVVYDYLAASMEEATPAAWVSDVVIWGEAEQSQLMYGSSSGWVTQRNIARTEGVWLSNRGPGLVSYFTSDSGASLIPPPTRSFTLTGLVANTEVRVYRSSDDIELSGVENSSATFTYDYLYFYDVPVYVRILHVNYIWISLYVTLGNANQSIPIQQIKERT